MADGLTLTLNAGSSTLKFAVFAPDGGAPAVRGTIGPLGGEARLEAGGSGEDWPHGIEAAGIDRLLGWIDAHDRGGTVTAVGHRVVHGGDRAGPARVDDTLMAELSALVPLAPLHQPHCLGAIRAVAAAGPGLAQVACFDTSFHRTMDALAGTLPLPAELREAGARRYGFHGLSYQYIAGQLEALDPARAGGRVIVAHLGSGASLCAMVGGRSVDTSMGMTALDGLVMATRPGRLDPGAVLWMAARGMDADAIQDTLYHRSGLLGVSGESGDIRALLDSASEAARLAVGLFVRGIVRECGALAAVMGGVDGLVFTAGIGEHQPVIRQRVGDGLAWLGLAVDPAGNAAARPGPARIGPAVWVVPTDEERQIAELTKVVLGRSV